MNYFFFEGTPTIVFPSPLITSTREGNLNHVTLLLERGEAVNQHDGAGRTALWYAVTYDRPKIVKVLLEHGADHSTIKYHFNYTVLMLAAENGSTDIVKILLEHGADHSAKRDNNVTALMWAALYGHTNVVKVLLKYGADPSVCSNLTYMTALMFAVDRVNVDMVEMLLSNGADHTAVSLNGLTALGRAINHQRVDCVQVLKRHIIQRIVDTYIAMLPLEQPVYQFWWIMELTIGSDISSLNEKGMITLLQGIRGSYNAMKVMRLKAWTDDG